MAKMRRISGLPDRRIGQRNRTTGERFLLASRMMAPILAFGLSAAIPDISLSQECHPSYEGECVPIASDVDCAGGSGNGPEYVVGPAQVVGPDV